MGNEISLRYTSFTRTQVKHRRSTGEGLNLIDSRQMRRAPVGTQRRFASGAEGASKHGDTEVMLDVGLCGGGRTHRARDGCATEG